MSENWEDNTQLGYLLSMKIQTRILILLLVSFSVFALVFYGLGLYRNFRVREILQKTVTKQSALLDSFIHLDAESLRVFTSDYSQWPQTASFFKDRNEQWARDNIAQTLPSYSVYACWLLNRSFEPIFSCNTAGNKDHYEILWDTDGLASFVASVPNGAGSFFVSTDKGIMEVMISGVGKKPGQAPVGYIAAARVWDSRLLSRIGVFNRGKVYLLSDKELYKSGQSRIEADGTLILVKNLVGLKGFTAARLVVEVPAPGVKYLISSFRADRIFLFGLFVVFAITLFVLLLSWVIMPLAGISKSLDDENAGALDRVKQRGDEFGHIAKLIVSFFRQKDVLSEQIKERKQAQHRIEEQCSQIQTHVGELEKSNDELESVNKKLMDMSKHVKESERLYRRLFYDNKESILLIDPYSMEIANANPAACRFYGYPKEQLRSMSVGEIFMVPESVLGLRGKEAEEYLCNNRRFEHRMGSGQVRDVIVVSSPIIINEKHLICSIVHDESVRIQAQDSAKRLAARLSAVFKAVHDIFFIIDENGNYLDAVIPHEHLKPRGIDISSQIVGKNFADVLSAEVSGRFLGVVKQTLKTGLPQTLEYPLDFSGRTFWFEGRTFPLEDVEQDGVGKVVWIARDITHIKREGFELQKLFFAVEQSSSVIMVTDPAGRVEYVNPMFTKLTGYSQNEVIGRTASILKSGYHDEDFYRQLWECINSGREWNGEFLNRKKDGGLFWVRELINPIRGEDGNICNFIAVKEDITQEKKMSQELKRQYELSRASADISRAVLEQNSLDGVVVQLFSAINTLYPGAVIGVRAFEPGSAKVLVSSQTSPVDFDLLEEKLKEDVTKCAALGQRGFMLREEHADVVREVFQQDVNVACCLCQVANQVLGCVFIAGFEKPLDEEEFGALGCIIDVFSMALREELVRESLVSRESMFRNIFYKSPVGTLVLDEKRTVIEANNRALALLGVRDSSAFIGQPAGNTGCFPPESIFVKDIPVSDSKPFCSKLHINGFEGAVGLDAWVFAQKVKSNIQVAVIPLKSTDGAENHSSGQQTAKSTMRFKRRDFSPRN